MQGLLHSALAAFSGSSQWPKLNFREKSAFSPCCEGEQLGKFTDTSQGLPSMLPCASIGLVWRALCSHLWWMGGTRVPFVNLGS